MREEKIISYGVPKPKYTKTEPTMHLRWKWLWPGNKELQQKWTVTHIDENGHVENIDEIWREIPFEE